MKFTSGMWINGKASNNPANTTRKNQNVVLSKNVGTWTNEDGFKLQSQNYNLGGLRTPIGVIELTDDRFCVFSVTAISSEIGVIDKTGFYTFIVNDINLNFSVDSPIHGEFYVNSKGETIVAFTDRDRNPPRILNLDSLPTPYSVDKLLMFPNYSEPSYIITESEVGGALKSGAKYITCRYVDSEGNTTRWVKTSKPIFITENKVSVGFDSYDGCAANTTTTKALNIVFTNVDTTFKYLEIALVEKIDGIYTAKIVGKETINNSNEFTITGNEDLGTLAIADILEENAMFDRVYAITQLNNTLYYGGVKEASIDDIQKYVNNMRLKVVSKKFNQSDFTGSCKTANGLYSLGFKHGEVYAMYFVPIMKDGSRGRAYHIPGRASANVAIPIVNSSVFLIADEKISCRDVYNSGINLGANLSYMLEDLAVDNNMLYYQTRDTSFNPNAVSNFGFHENTSEEYPTTDDYFVYDSTGQVGDLRGQKVRHHKFPSVKRIKEVLYPTDPTYGGEFLDVLGIEIDPNSFYLPQEILDKMQGWEIVYAERTMQNASIIGQDLLMFGSNHGVGTPVRSNAGNWNTLNLSNSQTQDILRDEARFHCFDLVRYKPSTTPSFIRNNLKLIKQAELYDTPGTGYNATAYKAVLVSDFGKRSHYIQSSGDNRTELPNLFDEIRGITNWKYIPNNSIDSNWDNRFLEEYIHANITAANGIPIDTNNRSYWFAGTSINSNTRNFIMIDSTNVLFGPVEETFLTDICVVRSNMYTNFHLQRLVSTGYFFQVGVSVAGVEVFGGDSFTAFHSFACYGIRDQWDYNQLASQDGLKAFKRFVCESFSNTEMRYYDSTSTRNTYYYPYGGASQNLFVNIGYNYYRDLEPNEFLYNKDYSSINNLNVYVGYDTNESFVTNHPNRIYKSYSQDPELQTSNWRTVKVNDYYEMPKNKGSITFLQGVRDRLIIGMQYATFETIGNETLPTSQGEVNLGTGDIFRVVPSELISDKNGYVGSQHKYGTCLTKYGLVIIDAEHGKVFLHEIGGNTRELSRENAFALHDFFRDGCKDVVDNPFTNSGLTISFDEKYERLIIAKKKFTLNQFGQQLVNGDLGPGHYLEFRNNRWTYVYEGLGIYQLVFQGDERFWDSSCWTVSYSFDFQCWASFHTYNPDYLFNTRNNLLSFKDCKLFIHNQDNKGIYYDQNSVDSSYITPVFVSPYRDNNKALISSLYGNVQINSELYDPSQVLIKEKGISSLMAWNSYQSTGEIEAKYFDPNLTYEDNYLVVNMRNAKNTFNFNKLRDLVLDRKKPFVDDYEPVITNIDASKPFQLRRKLIDKFLIVKLLYNNEKISNLQYEILFGDIAVFTKPSLR